MAKGKKTVESANGTAATLEAPVEAVAESLLASIPEATAVPEAPATGDAYLEGILAHEAPASPVEATNATRPLSGPRPTTKVGWIKAAILAGPYTEGNVKDAGVNAKLIEWICREENAGPNYKMSLENGFSVAKGQAVKQAFGASAPTRGTSSNVMPTIEEALRIVALTKETPNGYVEISNAIKEVEICLSECGGDFGKLKAIMQMIKEVREEKAA
jgi:hypothetical protein